MRIKLFGLIGVVALANALNLRQEIEVGHGGALAQTSANAEADSEMIMGILSGLVMKAAGKLLSGAHRVCCGGKRVEGECVAFDTEPVVSYITTQKDHDEPKMEHVVLMPQTSSIP